MNITKIGKKMYFPLFHFLENICKMIMLKVKKSYFNVFCKK